MHPCRVEPSPEPAPPPEPSAPAPDQAPVQAALLSPEAQNAAAVNSLLQLVQQIQVAGGDGHSLAARNALLRAAAELSLGEPDRPASASAPTTPGTETAQEPATQQAGNLPAPEQQQQQPQLSPGLPGYPMHMPYGQPQSGFSPGPFPYMQYAQPGSPYQYPPGYPGSPVGYGHPPYPQAYGQGGSAFAVQDPGHPMQYTSPQPGFVGPAHLASPQEQWGHPQYPPQSPAGFSQAGSQAFSRAGSQAFGQPLQHMGSSTSQPRQSEARNLQTSFSEAGPFRQAGAGLVRESSAGAQSNGLREPSQQPSRCVQPCG